MRSLIILRGLPGAGKSTLARVLAESKWPVYAIDDYFIDPQTGHYAFRSEDNHKAYRACEQSVEKAMEEQIQKIFVDNAFTLEWEMEPYFKLAGKYGYQVYVATVEKRHSGSNKHAVSDEQLKKMAAKYKVVLM